MNLFQGTIGKNLNRVLLLSLCLAAPHVFAADLSSSYALAKRNDAQFQAAKFNLEADSTVNLQAGAALLPQINFTAGRSEIDYDSGAFDDRYSQDQTELRLTQSLYHHEHWMSLHQANTSVDLAEAKYTAEQQSLMLRLASAYFDLLSAFDNQDYAEAEQDAISQQLEQTQQRYEVGLIAVIDVKEAQARYDLAVAQSIDAERQVATNQEALWVLTNEYAGKLARLKDDLPLIGPDPETVEAWVELAMANNPNYLVARHATEIARQEIEITRAGHYPSLDLIASHTNKDADGGSSPGESDTTAITVQLNVPIFSGNLTNSRTTAAHARFAAAQQDQEQARRTIVRQTRDAFLGTRSAISRVQALKQALVSTQAGADATRAGFEVGTRTGVDVLVSLRETYRAQRDYSRARYDYLLNGLRLKQAAGTVSSIDLDSINSWLR